MVFVFLLVSHLSKVISNSGSSGRFSFDNILPWPGSFALIRKKALFSIAWANTLKDANGEDKKIVELHAQSFDVAGANEIITSSNDINDSYMPEEAPDELIGDDEIPF